MISLPSRRTRFSLPTNPVKDVPLAAAPLPPRPFEMSLPEATIARPSRLVSTILPVSASTEASTPVWSFTELIAFTSAPFASFALTSRSPILTPLIVKD